MFDSQSGWKLNNQQISHLIYETLAILIANSTQCNACFYPALVILFFYFPSSISLSLFLVRIFRPFTSTLKSISNIQCDPMRVSLLLASISVERKLFYIFRTPFYFHFSLIFIISNKNMNEKKIQLFRNGIHSIKVVVCFFLSLSCTVINKGQTETSRYRFLGRNGGYCWVVTQATLIYDKQKPQSVVCVNYVIR